MTKLKMIRGTAGCTGCVFENKMTSEVHLGSSCAEHACLPHYGKDWQSIVVVDEAPKARATDPDTSHKADELFVPKRASIKDHILIELAVHGGCTGTEIANRCALRLNSVTPRFKELVDVGKIKDTGFRRDRQIVWALDA